MTLAPAAVERLRFLARVADKEARKATLTDRNLKTLTLSNVSYSSLLAEGKAVTGKREGDSE